MTPRRNPMDKLQRSYGRPISRDEVVFSMSHQDRRLCSVGAAQREDIPNVLGIIQGSGGEADIHPDVTYMASDDYCRSIC